MTAPVTGASTGSSRIAPRDRQRGRLTPTAEKALAASVLSPRQEARNVATLGGAPLSGQVPGRTAASSAAAAERKADLIVVGPLRDTSVAERLLGTVTTEVVRRAPCEVLVVRPRTQPTRLPVIEDESLAMQE